MSAEEFVRRVAPLLGVSAAELGGRRRGAELVEARELVGGLAVERWRVGVKALAAALGKSRDGVSLWVRRAARRRGEDRTFVMKLDEMDRRLAEEIHRAARRPGRAS